MPRRIYRGDRGDEQERPLAYWSYVKACDDAGNEGMHVKPARHYTSTPRYRTKISFCPWSSSFVAACSTFPLTMK